MPALLAILQCLVIVLPTVFLCKAKKSPIPATKTTDGGQQVTTTKSGQKIPTLRSKSQSIAESILQQEGGTGDSSAPTSVGVVATQKEKAVSKVSHVKEIKSEAKPNESAQDEPEQAAMKKPSLTKKESSPKMAKPLSPKMKLITEESSLLEAIKMAENEDTTNEVERTKKLETAETQADEERAPKKEPKLSLVADVNQMIWAEPGGQKTIKLTNNSGNLCAVKIKCSDNKLFVISPVFMTIQPGQSTNIIITRSPGTLKLDKIVICWIPCLPADKDLTKLFKNYSDNVDTMDIAQLYEKEIGVNV